MNVRRSPLCGRRTNPRCCLPPLFHARYCSHRRSILWGGPGGSAGRAGTGRLIRASMRARALRESAGGVLAEIDAVWSTLKRRMVSAGRARVAAGRLRRIGDTKLQARLRAQWPGRAVPPSACADRAGARQAHARRAGTQRGHGGPRARWPACAPAVRQAGPALACGTPDTYDRFSPGQGAPAKARGGELAQG